jgi:mannosyl-oligosaccharide alpha-1,2-mannosidase
VRSVCRPVRIGHVFAHADSFHPSSRAPRAAPHIPRPSPLIDARNILRPETVESLYIAFQLSGDPIYRQWGWDIFQAFVRHARLPSGAFASIKNVQADLFDEGIEHEDRMER